jgi:hypothetical protein
MSPTSAAAARSRLLILVAGLTVAACSALRPTVEPPIAGDPFGYVHIASSPPLAPFPVTVRFRNPSGGSVSRVSFEFDPGETVLIVFPGTPGDNGLEVNGASCEGQWALEENVETDVLLQLDDVACRVEVVGSHAIGSVHTDPPTEPQLDGQ